MFTKKEKLAFNVRKIILRINYIYLSFFFPEGYGSSVTHVLCGDFESTPEGRALLTAYHHANRRKRTIPRWIKRLEGFS